ncbi:MAG: hypothetical protein ACYSUT_02565 [Planctomycetota bacterium]|jgi:hypothetical protein
MQTQTLEPVTVLREAVMTQRPMDGEVASSVAVLAEKLAFLKAQSPMFEGVSFSPDVEAMMADVSSVMN